MTFFPAIHHTLYINHKWYSIHIITLTFKQEVVHIFECTCLSTSWANVHQFLSVCHLSVCLSVKYHKGVIDFLVCPNYHLLATISFCWLHCVFSVGFWLTKPTKNTDTFGQKICLYCLKYQTSGIARHILNGL